jgi:hypothetical protein
MLLIAELVKYRRLPSKVMCIMFGCTTPWMVSCSLMLSGSEMSHAWISLLWKQLRYRYLSSGDWRRSAGPQPSPVLPALV